MAIRWGLGPVFASEWLTTTRRWQIYSGRSFFVAVLLAGLSVVWWSRVAGREIPSIRDYAAIARAFYNAIIVTQLVVVLMAAPAATAGSISQDKARGNLTQLLVTDLSNTEIVLGKLTARLIPTLALVACALPILAIGSLLGGIDPMALTGVFAITAGLAVLGCTLAFTLSIWGTRPHEVLLATFAVWTIWLLANPVWEHLAWLWRLAPPPEWFRRANPFRLAFGPYLDPGLVGPIDFVAFPLGTLAISIGFVILSSARLRAVAARQADGPARRRGTRSEVAPPWWSPATLDRNPVLWREWHRRRPSPWGRALIMLYGGLAVLFSVLAIDDSLRPGTLARGFLPSYVNAFQVALGLPLLLVASATSLIEERALGRLDLLLTTPVSTRTIVLSKWWASARWVPWFTVLPALVASALAWDSGNWLGVAVVAGQALAGGAMMTSLGLALATWIARPGRAIAWAVAISVAIALAWPITVLGIYGESDNPLGPGLASVSPFYGPYFATFGIESPQYESMMSFNLWGLTWIMAQWVLAVALLLATLATFNRCLGRLPDRPRRPSTSLDLVNATTKLETR